MECSTFTCSFGASPVHVYHYNRHNAPSQALLGSALSHHEWQRAGRFYFKADRERFVIFRQWLREVLGQYLDMPAKSLRFSYGPFGKPYLLGSAIDFNLTHTADVALLAIAPGMHVGVDIEEVRPLDDINGLLGSICNLDERTRIMGDKCQISADYFFRLWTRKEAIVKALGMGLNFDLKKVAIPLDETIDMPALVLLQHDGQDISLMLRDVPLPTNGFHAAIATVSERLSR